MKKVLKIFIIVTGVLIILLISVPLLFKNRIQDIIKEQVNKNIMAKVDWDHFGINFFRGFPALSVNFNGVSVIGIKPFEGDTLAAFDRFELRVKPFSAIKGDLIVESVILLRPLINGIVLEDGTANWDILPESEPEEVEKEGGTKEMGLELKRFSVKGGRIFYNDEALDLSAAMEDFNLDLSGDLSMDQTSLTLDMNSKPVNAKQGGIRYLKDAELSMLVEASADRVNDIYALKKSRFVINGLELGIDGSVSMPEEEGMLLDLNFYNRETSFKTLLSLVPAVYLQDFESVKTSGSLQLAGSVKGIMNDSINPDVILNLQVNDGYFAYPDLPKDVSNVMIGLDVNFNGTDQDLTILDLHTFHLEIAGNPVDVSLHLSTPLSDMLVKGMARGIVDFSSLSDVVPLENTELGGKLETDISINTRMSYIEKEDYENVEVEGRLVLSDVRYLSPDLPGAELVSGLDMLFSPKFVYLKYLDAVMESSDLHAEGKLVNFIPYIFEGKTLSGEISVTSNLIDANLFLPEKDTTDDSGTDMTGVPEEPDALTPIETDTSLAGSALKIPENIDFRMQMGINKILYDRIIVENFRGTVHASEGVAKFDKLSMSMLGGEVTTSGMIDTRNTLNRVDVNLDVKNIDIPESYATFVTVERLAPMARYCTGTVNSLIDYRSYLDHSFEPVYESIDATGNLYTSNLEISKMQSLIRLGEILKNEKLKNIKPNDVSLDFTVKNGRVLVNPFDVTFEKSKMNISGSHGIDMTMDYHLDMLLARADLGAGANDLISNISALAAAAGLQIPESDFINVKAHIGGTFENPDITTDLSGNLKSKGKVVEGQVRDKVGQEIEKVEDDIRGKAGAEAEKIIKEAEAEASRIIEQAERAGANLVSEAEKKGEQLIREAGNNPLKKAAAQRAADELVKQAERQSANMVNEARKRADEIIARAKLEAERIEKE
ncbi:MAG TPA: AsmA family protein [Bacteroidaceae bacterium]|nr:AsmA family protein [Bacteroidaceae bacterium]